MKPRARFRNEVKSRFDDDLYEDMQAFKRYHGIETDSKAMERIASLFLRGVIGILRQPEKGVSATSDRTGPGAVRS